MSIRVKKNEENPESTEVLAESIIKIAKGFEKLQKEFTDEGLVSLINDLPECRGVGKTAIRQILCALPTLKGYYLRDKK